MHEVLLFSAPVLGPNCAAELPDMVPLCFRPRKKLVQNIPNLSCFILLWSISVAPRGTGWWNWNRKMVGSNFPVRPHTLTTRYTTRGSKIGAVSREKPYFLRAARAQQSTTNVWQRLGQTQNRKTQYKKQNEEEKRLILSLYKSVKNNESQNWKCYKWRIEIRAWPEVDAVKHNLLE